MVDLANQPRRTSMRKKTPFPDLAAHSELSDKRSSAISFDELSRRCVVSMRGVKQAPPVITLS
jgi:hypothetical protein